MRRLSSSFAALAATLASVSYARPSVITSNRAPMINTYGAPPAYRGYQPRYPFASARQNARRYISVVGRNGHATMQRVK